MLMRAVILLFYFTNRYFRIAYCVPLHSDQEYYYRDICSEFVSLTAEYMPVYSKRLKTHLILHMVDNMMDFGPHRLL